MTYYIDRWPSKASMYESRKRSLLRARERRNELIARQLANPRARKAVPRWIVEDALSRFDRTAGRLFAIAIQRQEGHMRETEAPEPEAPPEPAPPAPDDEEETAG